MNNFPRMILEKFREKSSVRIIGGLLALGLVAAAVTIVGGKSLGLTGVKTVQASAIVAQGTVGTTTPMPPMPGMGGTDATMPAMPGMEVTPTAMPVMPGMTMPTTAANPAQTSPSYSSNDMDALLGQMQGMMQSLQGMMGQLDQKGATAYALPTPTPTAVAIDMQAWMDELQQINRMMGPLMLRIQADLQGTPTADELASVRAQVEQLSLRMTNLMTQLQAARGNTAPVAQATAMPSMGNMSGMNGMNGLGGTSSTQPSASTDPASGQSQAMMEKVDELMRHMQEMMLQLPNQQAQSGDAAGQPGQMGGVTNMPTPDPMAGMSSSDPSMDDMMSMMDGMMSIMDNMMAMMDMDMKGGMSDQMGGMAAPTPMPSMSGSSSPMNDTMMMMDNMMMMMDNMMNMMDGMMGGGMMDDMDMMGMPDM